MSPEELANEVEAVIRECRERVEGVGALQYWTPGQPQKFESMDLDALFEYAEEELRDYVVYSVMLRIRLRHLREAFRPVGLAPTEPTDAGPDHYAGIFTQEEIPQMEPPRRRSSGGQDILPGVYADPPEKQ